MLPELAQPDVRRLVVGEQRGGGLGQEYLASVRSRADAGGSMDSETDVALVRDKRLACVQPHAHSNVDVLRPGVGGESALRVRGGCGGVLHPREGDEERVSLRVDDPAVVRLEGSDQECAVLVDDRGVAVAQPAEELGRAFDVREQERDRAGGELRRFGVPGDVSHPLMIARDVRSR